MPHPVALSKVLSYLYSQRHKAMQTQNHLDTPRHASTRLDTSRPRQFLTDMLMQVAAASTKP